MFVKIFQQKKGRFQNGLCHAIHFPQSEEKSKVLSHQDRKHQQGGGHGKKCGCLDLGKADCSLN